MSHSRAELVVGHRELDAQHQELFQKVAELQSRVQLGDRPGATAALRAFWDVAASHFATEQALMIDARYPDRPAHERAHQLFLADTLEIMREEEGSGLDPSVVAWALRRMPEWLRYHVETNDAPLARYLVQHEAKRIVGAALDAASDPPGKPRGS